jgi:hypothetical protein
MSLRMLCFVVLPLCLCACITPKTPSPKDSVWVPLPTALQVVARDLNQSMPVVLSDIQGAEGKQKLKDAIKAFQCADKSADPPLLVITGPVSLALQGSIQIQNQIGGGVGYPTLAQLSYQVQVAKAQQQQLTVPITFVAASALPNFFLGQNLTNVSALPDLPDPKTDPNTDAKAQRASGSGDRGRSSSDGSSACVTTSCDKVTLGQDKASLQLFLIDKANNIRAAVSDQIAAYPTIKCPTDQSVNFVLPAISIILPQGLRGLTAGQ